jgi:hypothetical protein
MHPRRFFFSKIDNKFAFFDAAFPKFGHRTAERTKDGVFFASNVFGLTITYV